MHKDRSYDAFVLLWPSWLGRQTHKTICVLRYLEVAGSDPVNSIGTAGSIPRHDFFTMYTGDQPDVFPITD